MDTIHVLVEQYIPLANKLAYQKKRSLPNFIDVEDLQSAAYLGLVEAANRFDAERGIAFSTFAYPRILGAINDHLRSLGRLSVVSIDQSEDGEFSLCDTLESKETFDDFGEILELISFDIGKQAENMLRCYYADDLSMKEFGNLFGVSESRVSQLFTSYKQEIRQRWSQSELQEMLAA